ncbi:hypothetical protein Pmani_016106 [Petrolisthes manimaculis]|uniref:Uncharacterized protein n=1 Tax=Petrolisthes manimaculis TaxID=1843537 RepID=A0AAE1UBD0_9EUCA|nr:hypothetical protein Pmani_016106 [Petrolisthes manimaculis]
MHPDQPQHPNLAAITPRTAELSRVGWLVDDFLRALSGGRWVDVPPSVCENAEALISVICRHGDPFFGVQFQHDSSNLIL